MCIKKSMFGLMLALGLGMLPVAQAIVYEGVKVPDEITLSGKTVSLNGVGLREKFWVNVYVGALYLPQPADTVDAAISQAPNALPCISYTMPAAKRLSKPGTKALRAITVRK